MINRRKKAIAPLGLKDWSNSASVSGALAFACTGLVVSMKKCFVKAKVSAAKKSAADVGKEET